MRAEKLVVRAYQRLPAQGRLSRLSHTLVLRHITARRLTWQDLPDVVQRTLCVTYLEHPAAPAVLPHLRAMLERSAFDVRLIALCAKLHSDRQEYQQAYEMLEHCIARCTRDILAEIEREGRTARDIKHLFERYASDTRALVDVWRYLDREARRDTVDRHDVGAAVTPMIGTLVDAVARVSRVLSRRAQGKMFVSLLELALVLGSEDLVHAVATAFVTSSCKDDIQLYSWFAENLKGTTTYSRHPRGRQQFLDGYKTWLCELIPDETAFDNLLKADLRDAKKAAARGRPARSETRIVARLLNSLNIAGRDDLIVRVVERTLARKQKPVDVIECCSRFLRLSGEPVRAVVFRALARACHDPRFTRRNVSTFLTAFLMLGDRDRIASLHRKGLLAPKYGHSARDLAAAYSMLGQFDKSLESLRDLKHVQAQAFAEDGRSRSFQFALGQERLLDDQQFLKTTNDILNSVPQPTSPCGVVVVVAKNGHELGLCPILALRELKERGFAVMSLVSGLLDFQPTGIADLDSIADQLNPAMDRARWRDEGASQGDGWTIDLPARKMTYRGIDVYWGVREDLGCRQRRYSVNFTSPAGEDALANNLRRIETFEVCLRRVADAGRRLGLPVRLIFPYVHMGSHYFARAYVQARAEEQDIALIHAANGFENYFTNFATDAATTLAVRDMTRHRELAGTYFVPADSFERFYQGLSVPEREALVDKVEQWVTQHRVQRQDAIGRSDRLQFLAAERQRGMKIVCLMGKVMFDLEMPRGDGSAHQDMREWFDHTLDIARANPHIHLLIKPHPHELREEIALYASEVLRDWLPADLPPNIHFLGHDEFNVFEMAGVLDLALLWNGTAALELGVLRVPTIVGALYGHINYPVGHTLPRSRAHYEQLLVDRNPLVPDPDVRLRSAALISYFRHPDNSIPYRYTHRGLTNRSIRHLSWFDEDLRAYRAHGDAHVTRIADRIVGASW